MRVAQHDATDFAFIHTMNLTMGLRHSMRKVARASGSVTAALSTSGVQASHAPSKRLTVVLDMDECLIHSVFEEDVGYRQHEERPDGLAASGECEKFPLTMLDGGKCTVNKRPGVDKVKTSPAKYGFAALFCATA